MREHIVITGVGRSGTTFLVKLLTELGFDTGFQPGEYPIFENCNAGLEFNLCMNNAPFIVKDPRLCDYLPRVVAEGKVIKHAFVPIRDLDQACKSRLSVQTRSRDILRERASVPRGLWDSTSEEEQNKVLAKKLYNLSYYLTDFEIPSTFIHFPRMIENRDYLYKKLKEAFDIDYDDFLAAFDAVVEPESVHSF